MKMDHSLKTGISFGLTSGIITTLGLMAGLHSGTHSKVAVLGGILTIAIADAFSDALGIHISEESENRHSLKEIWESTVATFLAKLVFALTFVIPVLLFELNTAMWVSIAWGLFSITMLSVYISKKDRLRGVLEHLAIAITVILATHFLGELIARVFG